MGNFDTVQAITANLQSVLEGLGAVFSVKVFERVEDIPDGMLPHGQIGYRGEVFEYPHGQKPEYATANFPVRIVIGDRNPIDIVREQQRWVHNLRGALSVGALNIVDLATTKLISEVNLGEVETEALETGSRAVLNCTVSVRYRET